MDLENPFEQIDAVCIKIDDITDEVFSNEEKKEALQVAIQKIEKSDDLTIKEVEFEIATLREIFDKIKHLKEEYLAIAKPYSKQAVFTIEEAVRLENHYSELAKEKGNAVWWTLTEEQRGEWSDAIITLSNEFYSSIDNAVKVVRLINNHH